MLMKSYEQRMETSGIADRIALLAHEHLVRMYEGMGFVDKGRSPVKFGGGGWTSLVTRFWIYIQRMDTDFANHRSMTLLNMGRGRRSVAE